MITTKMQAELHMVYPFFWDLPEKTWGCRAVSRNGWFTIDMEIA